MNKELKNRRKFDYNLVGRKRHFFASSSDLAKKKKNSK